jgi:hypothetical protein
VGGREEQEEKKKRRGRGVGNNDVSNIDSDCGLPNIKCNTFGTKINSRDSGYRKISDHYIKISEL